MRISSQSNQFVFQFGSDFVKSYLEGQFDKLMEKNYIPYDSVVDYINSTIKEIVMVGTSFETKKQILRRGKEVNWKDSKSVFDKFPFFVQIYLNSHYHCQSINTDPDQ